MQLNKKQKQKKGRIKTLNLVFIWPWVGVEERFKSAKAPKTLRIGIFSAI
jgi:hypothetical protein